MQVIHHVNHLCPRLDYRSQAEAMTTEKQRYLAQARSLNRATMDKCIHIKHKTRRCLLTPDAVIHCLRMQGSNQVKQNCADFKS